MSLHGVRLASQEPGARVLVVGAGPIGLAAAFWARRNGAGRVAVTASSTRRAELALMLGALTIQGIAPGPQVMTQKPDLFWGLVASMWIGNLMLVILNLPLIGLWVSLLKVPYRLLFPAIMAFSCVGIYSVNNSSFELYLTALFGLIGFVWMRLECPPAPMLLGFVLGPLMEENLRRALLISRGDATVFFTRPISLGFMIATVLIVIIMLAPAVKARREAITG